MTYVRGWHAWVAGGSEFTSVTNVPADLPLSGMQIIMVYFNDGTRRILAGNDFYFFHDNGSPDGIWGSTDDPRSDISARYAGAHIMAGSLLTRNAYSAIERSAITRKDP